MINIYHAEYTCVFHIVAPYFSVPLLYIQEFRINFSLQKHSEWRVMQIYSDSE